MTNVFFCPAPDGQLPSAQGYFGRFGGTFIPEALAIIAGVLLLAGLWTPVMASLVAVLAFWKAISQSGDPWTDILLVTIGAALALLGPGAWSADARLFGWKRIDIRDRDG